MEEWRAVASGLWENSLARRGEARWFVGEWKKVWVVESGLVIRVDWLDGISKEGGGR